jgi:uncharacterized membrane protein YeaQ/YmgE (transglycosylase-associated protein family)
LNIIALIIQIVAGAIGGNVAGAALKKYSLGTLGNTIAGVVGGGIGGQILAAVLGSGAMPDATGAATTAGGFDAASLGADIAGGGIGGAILMIVVGLIRKAMAKA